MAHIETSRALWLRVGTRSSWPFHPGDDHLVVDSRAKPVSHFHGAYVASPADLPDITPEALRNVLATQGEMLSSIAEDAKSKGCLHHRFAIGDGVVFVIDEWESPEAFQEFFQGNGDVPRVMAEPGARSEPEISFAEAVDSPDMF